MERKVLYHSRSNRPAEALNWIHHRNLDQKHYLATLLLYYKAWVKRLTSYEPNRMQMEKTLCSPSLSFISIWFGLCEARNLVPRVSHLPEDERPWERGSWSAAFDPGLRTNDDNEGWLQAKIYNHWDDFSNERYTAQQLLKQCARLNGPSRVLAQCSN